MANYKELKEAALTAKAKNPLTAVKFLESTVLEKSVDELNAVCKVILPVEFSARALGYACRFRGLEYVKVLLKHGVTFSFYPDPQIKGKYKCACRTDRSLYISL